MSSTEYHQLIDRYYRRNFFAATVDNMMFFFIFLGLSPFTVLPYYLQQLTDSKILIGLIPAIFILGVALPQPLMARFLHGKRKRLKYLVISAVTQRFGILAFFLLTLFQTRLPNTLTIVLFFVFFTFQNLASGFWLPAWVDFIGRAIPRKRGMLFGWSNFIGGALSLSGGYLMTQLLRVLPYPQAISALAGIALTASMISLGAILAWKEVLPSEAIQGEEKTQAGNVKGALSDFQFRVYLIWRGVMVGLEMATPFLALYALDKLALEPYQLGIFTLLMSIAQTVMNPVWGWLGDRKGYLYVILISAFLGVAGIILAILTQSLFLFYLVFLLTGIMVSGVQISSIAGLNIIYEFSSAQMVPTYLSLSQIIISPLSGFAPTLGGYLAGLVGYEPMFWISGILGLAGTIGMLLGVPNPKTRKKDDPFMSIKSEV
jgi:MFS family permease